MRRQIRAFCIVNEEARMVPFIKEKNGATE